MHRTSVSMRFNFKSVESVFIFALEIWFLVRSKTKRYELFFNAKIYQSHQYQNINTASADNVFDPCSVQSFQCFSEN